MAKIVFDHVTVQLPIYNAKSSILRNRLVAMGTGGLLSNDAMKVLSVTAVDNVSFELNDGDTVGVVGHNGAGKSTLLRTITGILGPWQGRVTREGSISSIMELGAGLEPMLSGYDNVKRIALLLGASWNEAERIIPDVELFTDLGDFLSMPVSCYSSGMMLRLMFSVATSLQPEILVIDEMLGVGDASFRKKVEVRLHDLISTAKIFVLASHEPLLIKRHCKRIFSMEHGCLTEINPSAL